MTPHASDPPRKAPGRSAGLVDGAAAPATTPVGAPAPSAGLAGLIEMFGIVRTAEVAHTFVRLWPSRRARITAAIWRRDPEAALDATLSLRSAASVLDEEDLAAYALRIHCAVEAADELGWDRARDMLSGMDPLGRQAVERLRELAFRLDREAAGMPPLP